MGHYFSESEMSWDSFDVMDDHSIHLFGCDYVII